jgi:putative PIN family toxin of toxin-antitoxin system
VNRLRLVVDTNVLVSALLVGTSLPAHLIVLWREGRFDLLTSPEQLDELMRVTRYPKLRERLPPALAGRLVNELRKLAIVLEKLPTITLCHDPYDDYLLAMAAAGNADFLVTGDKRDLLGLERHKGTRIVTVRDFLVLNGRLP